MNDAKCITLHCMVQEVTDLAFRTRTPGVREWDGRYLVKAKSYGPDEEEASRGSIFYTTHTAEAAPNVGDSIIVQVTV